MQRTNREIRADRRAAEREAREPQVDSTVEERGEEVEGVNQYATAESEGERETRARSHAGSSRRDVEISHHVIRKKDHLADIAEDQSAEEVRW